MYTGFQLKHFDYFDKLELDNSRDFWNQNKDFYYNEIRSVFTLLAEEYASELGTAKIYRPWRDVRFTKDKRPLKAEQSVFWSDRNWGFYLELSSIGVRTGFGYRPMGTKELESFRSLVDSPESGEMLSVEILRLKRCGWNVVGNMLKTAPRGYSSNHPRIMLLRYKEIGIEQLLTREEHIALADPALHFKKQIEDLRGVNSWFAIYASALEIS